MIITGASRQVNKLVEQCSPSTNIESGEKVKTNVLVLLEAMEEALGIPDNKKQFGIKERVEKEGNIISLSSSKIKTDLASYCEGYEDEKQFMFSRLLIERYFEADEALEPPTDKDVHFHIEGATDLNADPDKKDSQADNRECSWHFKYTVDQEYESALEFVSKKKTLENMLHKEDIEYPIFNGEKHSESQSWWKAKMRQQEDEVSLATGGDEIPGSEWDLDSGYESPDGPSGKADAKSPSERRTSVGEDTDWQMDEELREAIRLSMQDVVAAGPSMQAERGATGEIQLAHGPKNGIKELESGEAGPNIGKYL